MQRPSTLLGIDHIKLAASDLETTRKFYCSTLGFEYLQHYDHKKPTGELFAVMLQLQHTTADGSKTPIMCEVRLNPAQAKVQQGWDPM
jgi:catechol 2,3-dioxygenase-like lactoylglutathione lyase family enzyme